MGNTVQLTKNGQPVFPVTDVSLVMGLQDAIKLPPIKVTTLPTASADTAGKMYYVGPDANDEYERYITSATNGSYEWIDLGDTSIPLPSIADNETTDDANTAHSAAGGKRLNDKLGQLEAKVNEKVRFLSFIGNGNTAVEETLSGLLPGNSYRIWLDGWLTDTITSGWAYLSFYVKCDVNGNTVNLYVINAGATIPDYVDVTIPENVTSIVIGGRINSGITAKLRLEDITPLKDGNFVEKKLDDVVLLDKYVSTNAETVSGTSSATGFGCIFIPVKKGEQYRIVGKGSSTSTRRLFALYNYDAANNNFVRGLTYGSNGDYRSNPRYITIPDGVSHLAVNFSDYDATLDGLYRLNSSVNTEKSFLPFFVIGGKGVQRSAISLNEYIVEGHTYRVIPYKVDASEVPSGNTIIGVYNMDNQLGEDTRISDKITVSPNAISKYYDFTVPSDFDFSNNTVRLVLRSNFGYPASVFIQDITSLNNGLFSITDAISAFMDAVQRKSDNIGLTSSTWNNPYGGRLYGFNRTTVKDLLKATIYAAGNPRLMDFMGATSTKVKVWGAHEREVTITNDIPAQLATYYQTLHGSVMPYKILANKAGAHANEENLDDNGFSLCVVAIVSGHYVAAVVGIGNTSQSYTSGRNNRKKGMVELLDIVSAYYDGQDISGMSVTSCEKAIAAELPSALFPQCYRKDAVIPIHSQDADTVFMPASTSKVMAAITMMDFLDMGEFYRISDNADELVNDSDYTAYDWDVQTVETSFYAMLMASNGANTLSLARFAGEKILRGVNGNI